MTKRLFQRNELREWLEGKIQSLQQAVQSWNAGELLNTPEEDVVDYLVDQHTVH